MARVKRGVIARARHKKVNVNVNSVNYGLHVSTLQHVKTVYLTANSSMA